MDESRSCFHIQSIGDVELFGINGSNYGNFVIEKNEWERYGFGISTRLLASAPWHLAATTTGTGQRERTPFADGVYGVSDLSNGWRIIVLRRLPRTPTVKLCGGRTVQRSSEDIPQGHQFFMARGGSCYSHRDAGSGDSPA